MTTLKMEWRQIESAPRDGRWVLCWRPTDTRPILMRWDEMKHHLRPVPHWSSSDVNSGMRSDLANPPTHWMPLPGRPGVETPVVSHE